MLTILSSVTDNIMQESKFLIHGWHHRANDWKMRDCLSYLTTTAEEAVATCRRLNPQFEVHYVELDDSEPEVVKLQPLR